MIQTYTVRQLRHIERTHLEKEHITEREMYLSTAGKLCRHIIDTCVFHREITVMCGEGKNGTDGFTLAYELKNAGYAVNCCFPPNKVPREMLSRELMKRYEDIGGAVIRDYAAVQRAMDRSDLIIDAFFGTGFKGPLDKDSFYAKVIRFANTENKALRIAIDMPSGVNCESGECGEYTFSAQRTLVMTAHHVGLFSYPARGFCGEIELFDTGVEVPYIGYHIYGTLPSDEGVTELFPVYGTDSNKGNHGKLLCMVGSKTMPGAAVMSIGMALRSGVGLVAAASAKEALDTVMRHHAEPICVPYRDYSPADVHKLIKFAAGCTAVLIGCGLGQSAFKRRTVLSLIRKAKCQLIIDADGINLICGNIDVLKEADRPPILTPHPGEFSRLTGLTVNEIQSKRLRTAREFAMKYKCILVLKGAGTVVAAPEGHVFVNTSGTPGLAKGGSGDVLAGLIAGLAAQPGMDAFDAASVGVYLHGKGAEAAAEKYGTRGMLPTDATEDIAALIPSK